MAQKAKKNSGLTPEEKLAQTLVPAEEQLYSVPENWCWVHWGICGQFIAGNGFKNEFQGFTDYNIPFYKVGSLRYIDAESYLYDLTNTVNEELRTRLKASLIPVNSILFAKIGEAIKLNRRALNAVPCCIDNNMMAFVPSVCNHKYVLYWSMGLDLYDYTNATTVPAIRKSDLEDIPFPLAPLSEQRRIVARIESLFAKLDEAKEKAQAVVDGFETRKAAILHKAFTGELTQQWRKQNHVALEEWRRKKISQCCKLGSGGTPSRKHPEYYTGEIPWIKTGEIDWNEVYNSEEHITEQAITDSSAKLYAPGAVLVAMYGMGMTRGRAALLMAQAATNQAVCVLQPDEQLYNRFLYYFFMCNYWTVREMAIGGNQLNLSATIISKFEIPIPNISEQTQIVRILDELLTKEQQAKEVAETVIEQIDTMKKAILARAFRGELGTNDPAEESAVELLKSSLN